MENSNQEVPAWLGWVCVVVGAAICALAVGLIPVDESSFNAPRPIVFLCGIVFAACGLRLLTNSRPHISRWFPFVLVGSLGIIALWVGLYGKADAFSSSSTFSNSTETNVPLARWIFGGAGAGCLVLLAAMIYHWKSVR